MKVNHMVPWNLASQVCRSGPRWSGDLGVELVGQGRPHRDLMLVRTSRKGKSTPDQQARAETPRLHA